MRLSICIATIPERAEQFAALVSFLGFDKFPTVELVSDDRPRGSISIGAKRQAMIEKATGEYVVHIDDDDWVPSDYTPTILTALQTSPDCVGHYELVEGMAKAPQISVWTNRAPIWMEGSAARRFDPAVSYARTTFHKTPLKRSHALSAGFSDMGLGEDRDFSKRLKALRLCKVEAFVPRVLYFYRYDPTPKQYQ